MPLSDRVFVCSVVWGWGKNGEGSNLHGHALMTVRLLLKDECLPLNLIIGDSIVRGLKVSGCHTAAVSGGGLSTIGLVAKLLVAVPNVIHSSEIVLRSSSLVTATSLCNGM